jgi:iron-sulfur cluster assembly accessory protein
MRFLQNIFGGRAKTQVHRPSGVDEKPAIDLDQFRHRLVVGITPRAAEKLRANRQAHPEEGSFLRFSVDFQGPTGHMYDMQFDDTLDPVHDLVGKTGGFWTVVHSNLVDLLDGTIVDWRDTPQGGGFWFTNPNAIEP